MHRLTTIKLYGNIAEKYGKTFEFYGIESVLEAVDALEANFKGFKLAILKNETYNVFINDYAVDTKELELTTSGKVIKIVPVMVGASGTTAKIIVGAALIGLSFALPGIGTAMGLTLASNFTAGSIAAGVFNIGVGMLISGFAELIFKPPDGDQDDETSYMFSGSLNIAKEGSPVPIGYGRLRIGSTNISNSISANSNDYYKLSSVEYADILDVICEGEIEGLVGGARGIYLNDVPIRKDDGSYNIEDITTYSRNGTNTQSIIPGFESASSTYVPSLTECKHNVKVTNVISEPLPDRVRLTIKFTAGLYARDKDDGDLREAGVRYRIQYSTATNPTERDFGNFAGIPLPSDHYNPSPFVTKGNTARPVQTYHTITNYGVLLHITWKKAFTDTPSGVIAGVGNWINISIQYRQKGTSSWNNYYTNSFNIVDYDPFQLEVYRDYHLDLPEAQWEYQVTFHNNDVSSSTYNGISNNTQVNVVPTLEYLEDDSLIRIDAKKVAPFNKEYVYYIPQNEGQVYLHITRAWTDDDIHNADEDKSSTMSTTFSWAYITEIDDQKFIYPNTALVSLSFNAENYDNIPDRAYLVDLLKIRVPTNYDPIIREYSGLWDGTFKTEWSDNPAWAFYDLVTNNRFGLGQYIKDANINKWTLYEIAKFCDHEVSNHYGGKEPRYRINTYITKQEEALVLLRNLASIFRGMIYWMNNQITASYDHDSDATVIFSNTNVVGGTFTYTGSSKETRFNRVYVSWVDPRIDYKTSIELVEDTDDIALTGEIVDTTLTALGCTSRGQAFRAGRALLATERETVVFQTSVNTIGGKPGDLAEIYDRYRANIKYSGRVKKIEDNNVYLDGDSFGTSQFDPNITYNINLISSTGQTKELPNGDIETSTLPVIHTYTFKGDEYIVDGNYITVSGINKNGDLVRETLDIPENTVWSINETTLQPQIFRIISIIEKETNLFEINALAFNKTKQDWIDFDYPMNDTIYRENRTKYLMPEEVNITEEPKLFGTSLGNVILFDWGLEPNSEVKEFVVQYKLDPNIEGGGEWIYLKTVNDSSYVELDPNTPKGWYTAKVASVLHSGVTMPYVESKSTFMVGKTYPPKDITNFRYELVSSGFLRLSWDRSPELDLDHYEIRTGLVGFNWDTDIPVKVYDNILNTHFDVFDLVAPEFQIKAVDTSGIYSILPAKLEINIIPPELSNVSGSFIEYGYELKWSTLQTIYPVLYTEIYEGDIFDPTQESIVKSYNNVFDTSKLENWSDSVIIPPNTTHKYWLVPVDNHYNVGTEIGFTTNIPSPSLSDVKIDPEYLRIYMYFNRETNGGFPVRYVELKVNGVKIANIYGEYYSYKALSSGSTLFELTPYSIADRAGIKYSQTIVLDDGGVTYPIDTTLRLDGTIPKELVKDINGLTGPIADDTELWGAHFTSRGYTTIQDQIDAGYPNYLIPATIGTYTEVYIGTLTSTSAKISIRPVGSTIGILELKVYQSNGGTSYIEITSTLTNGKYITSGSFDRIKVDYIFKPDVSGNVYTLESALIIGETS